MVERDVGVDVPAHFAVQRRPVGRDGRVDLLQLPDAFTCKSPFAIVDSNVSSGMRPPNTDESVTAPLAVRSIVSSAVPLTFATTWPFRIV